MKQNRPLSPHLTIYRPQVTSMFSIFHRVTGALLAGFVLTQPLWMRSVTFQLHNWFYYNVLYTFFVDFSWLFIGVLSFLFVCFHYHLANGIRHIVWDINANTQLNLVQVIGSTQYILWLAVLLACVNFVRIFGF